MSEWAYVADRTHIPNWAIKRGEDIVGWVWQEHYAALICRRLNEESELLQVVEAYLKYIEDKYPGEPLRCPYVGAIAAKARRMKEGRR